MDEKNPEEIARYGVEQKILTPKEADDLLERRRKIDESRKTEQSAWKSRYRALQQKAVEFQKQAIKKWEDFLDKKSKISQHVVSTDRGDINVWVEQKPDGKITIYDDKNNVLSFEQPGIVEKTPEQILQYAYKPEGVKEILTVIPPQLKEKLYKGEINYAEEIRKMCSQSEEEK